VVVSALLVAEPEPEPVVPVAVVVAQIKPKKRPSKRPVETEETVVPDVAQIKPKKRPAKSAPQHQGESSSSSNQAGKKDIQISDLPSDEASWFNDMLNKLGTSGSLLSAAEPPPEIKKSFFPAHQQQHPALPPDCDVYSDDGIIDDYQDDDEKNYDKYVLEE
jgi:hypothetical protein